MKRVLCAAALLLCFSNGMAAAGLSCDPNITHLKTQEKSIAATLTYANRLQCGATKNVCVVYDIDNTLLTAGQGFGGDSWDLWQKTLADTDKNKVTNWLSASSAYDFEGALRYFITYRPVEPVTAATVSEIQTHYPSMAITARSFATYYGATKRELAANSIDFTKNPIGSNALDNTLLALNANGTEFKMYYHGVYYVAGDDKGLTLLNFIKYQRHLTANEQLCSGVVFVDDNIRNVNSVADALKNNLAFVSVHLMVMDANDKKLWQIPAWQLGTPTSQAQLFHTALQGLNR